MEPELTDKQQAEFRELRKDTLTDMTLRELLAAVVWVRFGCKLPEAFDYADVFLAEIARQRWPAGEEKNHE